ncbi:MAG: FAD-dependent oxidoreductase [Pseudomonadota bacterium]
MASIAIIGTGISGMGAAHLLHPHHDITVYERAAEIGGHTRTRMVETGGVSIPVDTGFIVFNERNYPNLVGLFKQLGVPVQKSDMTFAATIDGGAFEWCARDLNGVFGQRRNLLNPKFYGMIRDVLRFNKHARAMVDAAPEMTLGELVAQLKLGRGFLANYLLPMGGAIWSCSPTMMLDFPAATFVHFFENHGLLAFSGQPQWYTVTGGSREYVARITAAFAHKIRTNCAVVGVTRRDGKVHVRDSQGGVSVYDEVVFASHADQTLAMLEDASAAETEILGAFSYQPNQAVLHGDASVMPRRKRCWASWVYHARTGGAEPAISVTYWMNLLQSIDEKHLLFVTLNPLTPIAPEHVFDTHQFEHPVFTGAAMAAQRRMGELQGINGCWFAGAYTRYGFHEDGLLSAVRVAQAMGARIPWA